MRGRAGGSAAFSYYPPGELISGTGVRHRGGDADYTAYAAIRFPLADGPVQTYSQMFINLATARRNPGIPRPCAATASLSAARPGKTPAAAEMPSGGQNSYPWRDNFCERRGFFVGQCPSGLGHQGEDIVPVGCALSGGNSDQCDRSHHRVVAVHDGVVLRARSRKVLSS